MTLKTAIQFMALCVPFFLLTVWALVDVLTKDFGSAGRKVLWAAVAAVPFVGAPVYLVLGFRKGRRPGKA